MVEQTEGIPPDAALQLFQHARFATDTDEALPAETLTIHRGVRLARYRHICWTLDPGIATEFSTMRSGPERIGIVYAAEVESSDVLGYFTSRSEAEVIVDPVTLNRIRRFSEVRTRTQVAA